MMRGGKPFNWREQQEQKSRLLVSSSVAQLAHMVHKSKGSIDPALKHWGPQQEHALGIFTFQKDLGGYIVHRRTGIGESRPEEGGTELDSELILHRMELACSQSRGLELGNI